MCLHFLILYFINTASKGKCKDKKENLCIQRVATPRFENKSSAKIACDDSNDLLMCYSTPSS